MLPFKSLDTETFSQIVEKARKSINIYDPSWTDENYHDPGITFIELFAWLKEMQQFYINQVGFGNLAKYLKLLGGRVNHTRPAFVKADIVGREAADEDIELYVIPRGTRAYAENIAFETVISRYIGLGDSLEPGDVCGITTDDFMFEMDRGKRIKCYPFGQDCLQGKLFTIYFNKPLAKDREAELEFEIFEDYHVKRNIITGVFFELADLVWEYFTPTGWVAIDVVDNTHGLIRSGSVVFTPQSEMAPMEGGKYGVRCILKHASYDVAPLISNIGLNTIRFRQTYTLSEETNVTADTHIIIADTFLSMYGEQEVYKLDGDGYVKRRIVKKETDAAWGISRLYLEEAEDCKGKTYKIISYEETFSDKRTIGLANGLPYQVFEIDLDGRVIYYDGFALVTVEINSNGDEILKEWRKTPDFDSSGKYDRHYILDENTGRIVFGDGINGMCPRGKVIIAQLSLTYGKDGNVKRRQINTFIYEGSSLLIRNDNHAYGGTYSEKYDDAIFRLRLEFGEPSRAVTKSDYETIVFNTPGLMIENVIAYSPDKYFISQHECSPNTVAIAVKPFSENERPRLSEVYTRNILANLERYRLLGTEIIIQSPEYINIEIYVDLSIKEYYLDAQNAIKESIRRFFRKEYGEFGIEIQYDSIYGIIDTHEAVKGISALIISAKGNNVRREDSGNIKLPANGLGYLKELHFTIK